MANTYSTLIDLFTGIADAIRSKNGSTQAIIADNFPTEISNLKTGFDYNNQNATAISDYEFYNCDDLRKVDCYGLTSVGVSAFEGCENLQSVVLYDGVTEVGENAFKGCGEDCIIFYKGTSIPESWDVNWNPDDCIMLCGEPTTTLDVSATENDNVIAERYGTGLLIYGNGNMKNYSNYLDNTTPFNGVVMAIFHYGVTNIGQYAFYRCDNLANINIPNSVTNIGQYAFSSCDNLIEIVVDNNNKKYCSVDGVLFNKNKTSLIQYPIGNNCSNYHIPNDVVNIGEAAFCRCSYITSVAIPDSVTTIVAYAFEHCINLTSITYTGTIEQWNAITFGTSWDSNTGNYTIHCTDGDIAKDGTITYHTTE